MRRSIKTAIAVIVLTALSTPVVAKSEKPATEWEEVRAAEDGSARDFVDMGSINRSGETVRIRFRSEFAKGFNSLQSGEGELEVDCKANRARILKLVLVDENGQKHEFKDPGAWQDVVEPSPSSFAVRIACTKPGATSSQPTKG